MIYGLQVMNVLLRFLLELVGLAIYGYAGYKIGVSPSMKIIFSITFPITIGIIWSIFGSPKAIVSLPATIHLLLEVIVFLAPVALLFWLEKRVFAWGYGLIVISNRVVMWSWDK